MTAAAVWAVLSRIGGFLKLIPWQVYAVLSTAIFIYGYGHHEGRIGYLKGQAETVAHYEAIAVENKRLQARADEITQKKIDDAQEARRVADEKHRTELVEQDRKHAMERTALNKRITSYVTQAQNRTCPDVPRGYLVLRADAAAYANGNTDQRPSGTALTDLDAPSGVSLAPVEGESGLGPFLSDTDTLQAEAFRELRERVIETDRYAEEVKGWCTSTINALKGKS